MLFRRIPKPKLLSLIFLTSVLSVFSIFLSNVVSFANYFPLIFWGVSIILLILFIDSMFPSIKTTPGIVNVVFFPWGIILLFELLFELLFALFPSTSTAGWVVFENVILIVSGVAAIFFAWKKSLFHLLLTAVIINLAISGNYIIGTGISVVFCFGSIVWAMSLILSAIASWRRVMEWLKTPANCISIAIAILIILATSGAIIEAVRKSTSFRGWVHPELLRSILAYAIVLGSLSRFLPIRAKISKKSWIYWWAVTALVSGLVFLSGPLLSQVTLLFGLGIDHSGLVEHIWIILTPVLGAAVFLWAQDDLKWQWRALTIGCVGGVLLGYLWGPLVYTVTYMLYVPTQKVNSINAVNSFQLAGSLGLVIILLTGFLAIFSGKPDNRKQAVIAASLAGAMLAMLVFISSGTIISAIASQASVFDVAYSRTGYDELGFISSVAEAATYVSPWVHGALLISLFVGLLPLLLIGITWPIRRGLAAAESRGNERPVSVLILSLGLFWIFLIDLAVFRLLDDRLLNSADYAGLRLWWKPDWIVPLTVSLPLLLYAINIAWIFLRAGFLTKSFRNALIVCISGLILALSGLAIYFVAPEVGLLLPFLMLGIGIEMFRQGIRLWKPPIADPSLPRPTPHDSLSQTTLSTLVLSFASLPLTVIAIGLALITVAAITELRNVNAPPPGAVWLLTMTEDAAWSLPILSLVYVLSVFVWVFIVSYIFNSMSEPVAVLYWWGKLKSVQGYLKRSWVRSFFGRIRSRDLNLFLYAMGAFLVVILIGDVHWLVVVLFPLSYLYLKYHPFLFRDLSWSGYVVSGLLLLTSVAAILFSVLDVISIFAGPALAVIYRGVVVQSYASRRPLYRILFFPILGIFFLLYTNYLAPVSIVENGVARFSDQRWENVGPENSPIVGNKNYLFLKDSQGNLWLSGHYGPEALRKGNEWVKVRFLTEQNTEPGERMSQLAEPGKLIDSGVTYLFVGDTNLYIITPRADGFASGTPSRPMPPSDTNQQSPVYGVDATRCSNTVIVTDRECPNFTKHITSAAIDQRGDVWIGTDGTGIARFHQSAAPDTWDWKFFDTTNSSILSDYVADLLADDRGNIWALSPSGIGLLSSQGRWTNYSSNDMGLKDSRLQTIYEDEQKRIWVGSSTGVSAWDGQTWQATFLAEPVSVYGFYEDRRDQIWMLTGSGAWMYSNVKWDRIVDIPIDPFWKNPFRISSFYRMEPYDTGIRSAIEDHDGYLWFGGPRGLVRYDTQAKQAEYFYPSNSGLPSENVQDIEVDKDGVLWVSTYTQNTAHRSELPVLGFALVFISLSLGIIYTGYQRTPQYRASRISNKLSNRSQPLLSEIYAIFKDTDANDVLKALTIALSSQRELFRMVAAYTDIVGKNEISSKDKAEQIANTLQESSTLVGAAELSCLYQFISRALQAKSITDIGNLHLIALRSRDGSRITIKVGDAPPFEFPALVERTSADALEMLGTGSALVRKYLQVESTQDRLSFIADSLSAIERAKRDAEHVSNPEGYFMLRICDLWLEIIGRELDVLSGHANLRVDFRTKQIRQLDEVTVMLRIMNVGSAVADQVRISLLPNDKIHLQTRLDRQIEYISAGNSEVVEFTITTPPKGDVRVVGEITWRDRIENSNRIEFADVIRFYETSDRFERIPNPYIVGHPVKSPELFRGREDIFEFILHNLQGTTQSRTLVLYGQRRTGKTSILYQLLAGRLGTGYIPVLLDVQELAPGINNMADMFMELALQIEKALRKAGMALAKVDEVSLARSPTRSFSRFLDIAEDQLAGRKIVLMFDEFELLEDRIQQGKLEAEALGYLRSLMQHRDNIVFLFTGTHKLEQMSKDYWSIFFNIALHQEISFMDRSEAVRLIRDPVLGTLSIDDLVVEKMLSLTHGHPYFIQLLCWALVNHCNKTERNYATLNDFNDVLKEIVSSGDAYFAYIWTQTTPNERIVLAALAERMGSGKNAIAVQEITDVIANAGIHNFEKTMVLAILDSLTKQNILVMSGVEGLHYSYHVGLIGEWVKCSKPLRYLVERDL